MSFFEQQPHYFRSSAGGYLKIKFDSNTGKIWFACNKKENIIENTDWKLLQDVNFHDIANGYVVILSKKSDLNFEKYFQSQLFTFCGSVHDDCIEIVDLTHKI